MLLSPGVDRTHVSLWHVCDFFLFLYWVNQNMHGSNEHGQSVACKGAASINQAYLFPENVCVCVCVLITIHYFLASHPSVFKTHPFP